MRAGTSLERAYRYRALLFTTSTLMGLCASAYAQNGCSSKGNAAKAGCVIPNVFSGVNVSSNHNATFPTGDFTPAVSDLTTGFLNQLTSLPLPSPASGITYAFDPSGGIVTPLQQSFGPVLAERAETIGRKRFNLGFSFQRFTFETVDGISLHNLPSVFRHAPVDPTSILPGGTPADVLVKDVITANTNIDLSVNQYTMFGTYGLTNRVDISLAVPVLESKVGITSAATIQRIGTGPASRDHVFSNTPEPQNFEVFGGSKTASGIGDVVARVKVSAIRFEQGGFAFATDVRVPTGDAYNLLGSGTWGIKPFVAFSYGYKRIAPHFNFGYQLNGSSVLAGDVVTGKKGHVPNQFPYAVGFDVGVVKRLTFDFDIIGEELINAKRLSRENATVANGMSFPNLVATRDSINITNGAIGFKVNPVGRLLLSFDVLFKMNDGGLRDKVTPLFGISFTR